MGSKATESLIKSLSFDVEAVPQRNALATKLSKTGAPMNLKIRVRKKEGIVLQKNTVLRIPNINHPERGPEKVRLASSDQTIMSFDVFMETHADKTAPKKNRKLFGGCFSTESDDDEASYEPSTIHKDSKSDTNLTQQKNNGPQPNFPIEHNNTKFFGKCKPGGCLDPPYGEDRYQYKPNISKEIHDLSNGVIIQNTKEDKILVENENINKENVSHDQVVVIAAKPKNKIEETDKHLFNLRQHKTSAECTASIKNTKSSIDSQSEIDNKRHDSKENNIELQHQPRKHMESSVISRRHSPDQGSAREDKEKEYETRQKRLRMSDSKNKNGEDDTINFTMDNDDSIITYPPAMTISELQFEEKKKDRKMLSKRNSSSSRTRESSGEITNKYFSLPRKDRITRDSNASISKKPKEKILTCSPVRNMTLLSHKISNNQPEKEKSSESITMLSEETGRQPIKTSDILKKSPYVATTDSDIRDDVIIPLNLTKGNIFDSFDTMGQDNRGELDTEPTRLTSTILDDVKDANYTRKRQHKIDDVTNSDKQEGETQNEKDTANNIMTSKLAPVLQKNSTVSKPLMNVDIKRHYSQQIEDERILPREELSVKNDPPELIRNIIGNKSSQNILATFGNVDNNIENTEFHGKVEESSPPRTTFKDYRLSSENISIFHDKNLQSQHYSNKDNVSLKIKSRNLGSEINNFSNQSVKQPVIYRDDDKSSIQFQDSPSKQSIMLIENDKTAIKIQDSPSEESNLLETDKTSTKSQDSPSIENIKIIKNADASTKSQDSPSKDSNEFHDKNSIASTSLVLERDFSERVSDMFQGLQIKLTNEDTHTNTYCDPMNQDIKYFDHNAYDNDIETLTDEGFFPEKLTISNETIDKTNISTLLTNLEENLETKLNNQDNSSYQYQNAEKAHSPNQYDRVNEAKDEHNNIDDNKSKTLNYRDGSLSTAENHTYLPVKNIRRSIDQGIKPEDWEDILKRDGLDTTLESSKKHRNYLKDNKKVKSVETAEESRESSSTASEGQTKIYGESKDDNVRHDDGQSNKQKDSIFLDFAFQKSTSDTSNQVFIKTVDALPNHKVNNEIVVVKTVLNTENNKVSLAIDEHNELSIKYKKVIPVSTASSQRINFILPGSADRMDLIESVVPINVKDQRKGDDKEDPFVPIMSIEKFGSDLHQTLSFIYEKQLVPLQKTIKSLKEDIDFLANQQILLRERIHGASSNRRIRPIRLVHSSKRCVCIANPR